MPHRFDLAAIGAGLGVADAAGAVERAAGVGAAVVTAPPGTGKTTFVPPLIANLLLARASGPAPSGATPAADATRGAGAPTVLLTQPRRVAVRAAAARIAHLDGSPVGAAVGFTVRGERVLDPGHRLEVLTPGVLLRRLLAEPDLPGVGAVVLDEVHERSVDGDLLLGMLAEVRELRDDLIVVAMSATLNAERVADLLGAAGAPAPIVEVPSTLHPLRVEYAPCEHPRLDERGVTRGFLAHVAAVAAEAQRVDRCDALVFVPGAREVDELVRLLRARVDARGGGVEVLALHGRLDAREQDRAVRGPGPGDAPRIVVSTALAESSLTVPGVRLVVDAGLAREVRRDQARSMTGLVTVSASRASAVQRAGRAARLGPGRAVRAYSEGDFARMPADAPPEIASADLTDAALLLAAWGTPRGDGLALLTRPPEPAMHEAEGVLRALALVDAAGGITALGRRIAPLPVGAREARALLAGCAELGDARGVAEVVAAMSGDFRDPGSDLARVLAELRAGRAPGAGRWRGEARRLLRIAAAHAGGDARRRVAPGAVEPGAVLALARPEWIARRVDAGSRAYLLASGTRAALPEGSPLLASSWIAVREVQRADGRAADGTGAVVRLAAALREDDALRFGAALRTDRRAARIAHGRVQVRQERRLGAILLSSTPVAASAADTAPAIALMLRDEGLASLPWSEAARGLRARLALLHAELGSPWPDVGDAALIDGLEEWLGPDVERFSGGSALRSLDLATALRRLLPWPDAARFEQLAPERLAVPSGGSARIVYPEPGTGTERPIVAVKLQEVFGLARTPALVDGRVPVLFHLLSPARRPLAVTDDLESFWNGPYQQVRKEMRGRYPKHPWPEDPWSAPATARTKRAPTP
ncbi:ATP-dependent helicase HrpB [Leucobacter chromiiresistens]|uniref:Helicase n=1 Tax=Leucobacter chromiiresistens TaxID=1079994 RepID=A0A147EQC5_9MICO|nr:ATP-dependent helicase HrpB [Leucobacter chromiiresistens]KTR86751.1 helicase [Leucobacter chromiiresistens]